MDVSNTNGQSLEQYFQQFRNNIIGTDQEFHTPYGKKRLIYADWTASGRLYRPIEEKLIHNFGPFVANTHTETTVSGTAMTLSYKHAQHIIKKHVNASEDDVFIAAGTGMTGAINKFQRLLGLRVPDTLQPYLDLPDEKRPIVFVSHMEHHSNQTSWLETLAEVVVMEANEDGLICLDSFAMQLEKFSDRPLKIASVTACSNVTGIQTPYFAIAKMIHDAGGYCFVDFACSGPYQNIDMHPDKEHALDAIFFSPHKFLGGPGTNGVLIFNKHLYQCKVPDHPGGGTVIWTDPWGNRVYYDNIEAREDGGTPGFLQVIKTALAIQLKEEMGVDNIIRREEELLSILFPRLRSIPNLVLLAEKHEHRLGIISIYIKGLHYNLGVKLLNDRFGIQTRGGCSCAGTYGHYLLEIDPTRSEDLKTKLLSDLNQFRPGWIRISIHPTMSDEEALYICDAVKQLAENHKDWAADYYYDEKHNEFIHVSGWRYETELVAQWFGDQETVKTNGK